jgi:hypothetical protein
MILHEFPPTRVMRIRLLRGGVLTRECFGNNCGCAKLKPFKISGNRLVLFQLNTHFQTSTICCLLSFFMKSLFLNLDTTLLTFLNSTSRIDEKTISISNRDESGVHKK